MFLRARFFLFALLTLSLKTYSQGCVTPQGVLTGSSICKGLPANLTFTASAGTAPFTITYTNGISTFTQSNVQSGVVFNSADVPITNATYTLVSIKDAIGCATTGVPGLSTGSNGIVNGDFSAGNSGFASGYGYSTSGLPPAVYFVGTDPVSWNPGMAACHDHTTGTGNMLLVNGADVPNVTVWTETIPVTPNTSYQFSTWIENISTLNPAQLQFSINGIPVGGIFQANNASCVWDQFYTTWNSGSSTSATISILNENTSFSGNDFALDDINFAPITALNNSATVLVQNCPAAEPCNNWLQLPTYPSNMEIGDLDVPGNQVTVEAMINRTAPYSGASTYAGDIVSKHIDPTDANYLLRPDDAEITTSNGYFITPPVCDIKLNKTYHVAMVYDGTTLKFYRDGFLLSQVAATGNLIQNNWQTAIGLFSSQALNTQFIGYINEVRIWNVARTQAQIQSYMNTSLPNPTTQTGLLAYYTFDNLLNKQGNNAWNGVLRETATIGQTNPTCSQFAVENCCPTLQGVLTGSNTCNNAPGLLTFHNTGGMGVAPFTIVYTDGVQTYTQPNVTDGVAFAVQVQPTVSTVYTLVSIQDATAGCAATVVPPGITAAINPGNCSLCQGALGDPVIDVTFGSGNGNSPPLEVVVPGASSTNLTYVPVSGDPALPTPVDGQNTITNNVPFNVGNAWFSGGRDHTDPNNPNGYMLFENAGLTPGEFFRQTVPNLCGGTTYEYAAWVGNADNPAVVINAILPDLTFIVETPDGTVLNTYNSGPVPTSSTWIWRQYGFFFTLPPNVSTVVIRIINNNVGGNAQPGNDFAIDDITFRACGPASTASFTAAGPSLVQTVCEGLGATLYGTLSTGYANPQYLWQVSQDSGKTWIDLPSSNTPQLPVLSPVTGRAIDYRYRLLAADGNNIQSPNCRIASNQLILSVTPAPNGDFSFTQNICNPAQVQFAGIPQPGVTYTWNINGVDQPVAAPGDPALSYTFSSFGIYPVTLKVVAACSGSVSKTIAIELQPADIISTPDTPICVGKPVPLRTHASLDFCWQPALYLDNPASPNPIATPPVTTKYYFTAKTTGTNMIVNGDFEAGNTGFTSVYTYMASGLPEGVYFVGTSPHVWNSNAPVSCGDHTTGSGNMMIVNGATTAGVNVWAAAPLTVTPNTNYAFSVWIQSVSPISPAILQFSINGTPLGNPVNASSSTCAWNQFYTTWNSGSNSTASISLVNNNTAPTGNDFALDDLSFAPVIVQIDSVTIDVETPVVNAAPDTTVCIGMPAPLRANGSLNYAWSPAAGLSNTVIADPIAVPLVSTDYIVTGTSARGCIASDTVTVALFPRLLSVGPDTTICLGDPAPLTASGGVIYSWSPAQYLDDPASATPLARPDRTTRFYLNVTDGNQCPESDSVTVSIRSIPVFRAPPDESVCYGFGVILNSVNAGHYIYAWSPATGLDDPAAPYPLAQPAASLAYTLQIRDSVCAGYDSSFIVQVTVKPSPIITAEKDNDIDCTVHTAQLRSSGGISYVWTPVTGLNDPSLPTPIASIDSTTTYIVRGTGSNGCYAFDTLTVNVTATGSKLFAVPNAFTPNGDGHNDCFGVSRWGDVQLEEMEIFNRYGQRVFTTRNPSECWDGTFRGNPQPAGGYAYVIRAHSFCGEITQTGIVLLIR
ncbi:MAG TPA: gliding motility-associated C-terminal domain-containing protein [Puia sp.]|jgi:gliding motility-associated-like protein